MGLKDLFKKGVSKVYTELKSNRVPDIVIRYEAHRKMTAYADLCDKEISALGSIVIRDNVIYIDDIFLIDQTVTSTSTILSPESISKFMCDYISTGKNPSTLKFWWHSHVNMGVFWSGTDVATINRFSSDWMISMVSNKEGKFKVRLDIFEPFRMFMDELPIIVEYDKSLNSEIQREIDSKVRSQAFPGWGEIREMISPQDASRNRINTHPSGCRVAYPDQFEETPMANVTSVNSPDEPRIIEKPPLVEKQFIENPAIQKPVNPVIQKPVKKGFFSR